jgi:hypothetical protein
MVKVLSRGGQGLKAVGRHFAYLNRDGEVEIETDDGQRLLGQGVEKDLLEDWDLDLEEHRRKSDLESRSSRPPPKLVHKIMFSMPAGTPPDKVLAAVKNLAREEFALKHRYAMVLHMDEPHPHVHMVVKAVSEQSMRLNIKKATLRHWRSAFARNLRLLGVEANATERAVRGETRKAQKDGIYRASLRRDSTYIRAQAEAVAAELLKANSRVEAGKRTLVETRRQVTSGWRILADNLAKDGHQDLARDVQRFADRMRPPRTERELIAHALLERARDSRVSDQHPTR